LTARLWLLEAVDTLFFRDGTPFIMGETDSRGIQSKFPPAMTTVQGAIRTALAMGQGWRANGHVPWPEEVLGSTENIGLLRLKGPYLALSRNDKPEFLFPFPASVVKIKETYVRLDPGEDSVSTDISSNTRLPELLDADDVESVAGKWLTAAGLAKILAGLQPLAEEVIDSSKLWKHEQRVGIRINRQTRTVPKVQQGALYSLTHVRPCAHLRLAAVVSGVPDSWHQAASKIIPLGGESRMAFIEIQETSDILPVMPELVPVDNKLRFTVTLVTPGLFGNLPDASSESLSHVVEETRQALTQGPLPQFGPCISACIPKLTQAGGWDIVNKRPRPLRPVVIPGSSWFYETDATRLDEIRALHGSFVGDKAEMGYGQILIGRWG